MSPLHLHGDVVVTVRSWWSASKFMFACRRGPLIAQQPLAHPHMVLTQRLSRCCYGFA